jgi:hypothetical protein
MLEWVKIGICIMVECSQEYLKLYLTVETKITTTSDVVLTM